MKKTFQLMMWMALLAVGPVLAQGKFADPELQRFLMMSVLDGLYEMSIPDEIVDKLLSRDSKTGLPYSFIAGCPICNSCYDALALYRVRPARVDGPRDFSQGQEASLIAALSSDEPAQRTSAFSLWVKQNMKDRLAKTSWSADERAAWQIRFEAAARVGQQALKAGQQSGMEAYQMMWSCQLCDSVTNSGKEVRK